MTTLNVPDLAGAAAARAAQLGAQPADAPVMPGGPARSLAFPGQLRVQTVKRNGDDVYHLAGVASVYERAYEMWDWAGPYMEIVSDGAGKDSLAANPDVAFLTNHRGVTMARTTNGTLELREGADPLGLHADAYLNPKRQDVQDLYHAVDDRNIDQMSFAFMITDGQWSPDYTEYRINAYDIHRGDVSAVNYGANPYTSVAARSREILADLDRLPAGAARAALQRLQHRPDLSQPAASQNGAGTGNKQGRSIALIQHMLLAEQL